MEKYFNDILILQNTLLPYFCEAEPLKYLNKQFLKLNYEKYNTYIQPHGIVETCDLKTKMMRDSKTYKNGKLHGLQEYYDDDMQMYAFYNYIR